MVIIEGFIKAGTKSRQEHTITFSLYKKIKFSETSLFFKIWF